MSRVINGDVILDAGPDKPELFRLDHLLVEQNKDYNRSTLQTFIKSGFVEVDGKRVSAGLKFSHDDAAEIWRNRGKYIGKLATIKYFNRTPDGSLRFPKCIQIDRESYE